MADLDTTLHNFYRSFSSVPDISGARFCKAIHQEEYPFTGVELKTSQRDFSRKIKRRFSSFIPLSAQSYEEIDPTFQLYPIDDSSSVGSVTSPSGKLSVILRSIPNDLNNQGKKGLYIEVYHVDSLVHNINMTSIHGDFYGDGTFGCLRFNKNETMVVYVAERDVDSEESKKEKLKNKPWLLINDESEAYEEDQDWGETFINKRRPSLFVLNLSLLFTDKLSPIYAVKIEDVVKHVPLNIPGGDELFDPGQACFSPTEDEVLYFTGYNKTPRKHGIIYCQNRPSRIFKIKVDGSNLCAISSKDISSRNPQFYNDCGEMLYYLQSETGGAHASCSRIAKLNLNSKKETILLDFVSEHNSSNDFPGLYADALGHKLLSVHGQHFIVLGSLWRSHKVILAVNIESVSSKPIFHVISDAQQRCDSIWSFLDVTQSYILASRSKPNLPSELLIGKAASGNGQGLVMTWKSLYKFQPHYAIDGHDLDELKWEVYNHPERDSRLECILIKAVCPHAPSEKKSLIINMHGGPHSASNVGWNWLNACLSWIGFDILHVNYSGSIGYGSDFVNKLVGRIGDLDVKDCQYAMEKAWAKGKYHKRFVMGGSHGGFLTAHIIGQYPDYYSTCMLRNPVINLGAMSFTTDIPDWCFAEAGLRYDFNRLRLTSPDEYSALYRASPLQYVDSLKTPILLLLGLDDRRVPPSQGLQWYNQVSARHPGLMKMKLISNTGHPLDSTEGEYITLFQTAKLFLSAL